MEHAKQVALIRRILGHLERKTSDRAEPSQQAVEAYTDPRRFDDERAMLARMPVAVAHASDLPQPGDFLTHDGWRPLLLVRQDDGSIKGLLNVCRHRGTRVEFEARGNRRRFSCPYHAWTYHRDGRLAGVPHRRGFDQVDAQTHSLREVPVTVAGGMVWAGGDPDLGALAEDLAGFGLTEGVTWVHREHVRPMNWKLVLDIFLEAYHVRVAHAKTIAPMFIDNLYLVDPHPPHMRNVFPKKTIVGLAERDEATWRLREHSNVLYVLYPNTLVLVQPDHSAVLHLCPLAVDRTLVQAYGVIPAAPSSDKARAHWDANTEFLDAVTEEDFALGATIQANLRSGANEVLTFGSFEHALALLHAQVERDLANQRS